MEHALESITNMVYPGRLIIIGKSPAGAGVVLYAITGRSPSSQARRLELDEQRTGIFVRPTDEETLKTGNPDLLVYPAVLCGGGIAVSNGKQTEDVFRHASAQAHPVEVLLKALARWEYEPDAPNYTPRISGCLTRGAALSILKRAADGAVIRNTFELPLTPGTGKLIATYTGANENPLPSFAGEPRDVALPWDRPDEAVEALYAAMGPAPGAADFRVAAAAVYAETGKPFAMQVKNRHAA